jgi:hypothetical protein
MAWGCSEVEMKTQGRILFVAAGSLAEFGALVALLADPMGALPGFLTALAAVTLAVVIYLPFVRWRARWFNVPASAPWIALSDPSSFTTERRMLLKIKARAEYAARSGLARRR